MHSNHSLVEIEDRKLIGLPLFGDLPVEIHNAKTLSMFKRDGLYGLGEAYARGYWSSDSIDDLIFQILKSEKAQSRQLPWRTGLGYIVKEILLNSQRISRAFEVGEKHYDLGNDLFQAMLDSTMTYTSGYWKNAMSLQEAQEAKLDLICRKLGIKPGMKVLDIGCGWGNFAYFAAKEYGAHVVGVTVSKEQAEFARERCADLPVEIRLQDYRTIKGVFDRIVSIEMIEAVGRKNMQTYFNLVHDRLKEGGLFLLQAISSESFSKHSKLYFDQFILWLVKHIFPNGYLPKLHELTQPAREGFVIEDWHNFGTDYDLTLQAWSTNFERNWDSISQNYSEKFKLRWRYYLNTCAALFRAREVQLYQIVYSKGGVAGGYQSKR